MKITILNGNPDGQDMEFEGYLERLEKELAAGQHQVTLLNLREMDLRYCVGCFGCWVKTPGECITPDDGAQVCRAVINSDFTLWASPLRMGFPSALLKKTMDKTIGLIHPYFVVDHNEAHHRARYAHYPRLGLLLGKEAGTDAEDIRIVTDIFARTALNMKSRLYFSLQTDQPVEQAAAAINIALQGGGSKNTGELFEKRPRPTQGVQVPSPARLTVFNGSPRGSKGNTPLLLDQFLKGFTSLPGKSYEVVHLNHIKQAGSFVEAYARAECVLLGFPLYTDGMPGIVKAFIEQLEPFQTRKVSNQTLRVFETLRVYSPPPPIGFFVQSGFPEAAHSRHVEHYLEKLARRLGSPYLGTIVKGGCEGIRLMPPNMTARLFESFYQIGRVFGETGRFDPTLLHNLAKPERYSPLLAPVFKIFARLPVASFYWDGMLKENGAYERRFAHPYDG